MDLGSRVAPVHDRFVVQHRGDRVWSVQSAKFGNGRVAPIPHFPTFCPSEQRLGLSKLASPILGHPDYRLKDVHKVPTPALQGDHFEATEAKTTDTQ